MYARFSRFRAAAVAVALAGGVLGLHASGRPDAATHRVIVVGDIHGDLDGFANIIRRAGLIDGRRRWQGGNAVLVQTGDYLDRGPRVREVLDLFMSLEREAKAAGGEVVVLLGNHEAMNLIGEMRDVAPEVYESFADDQSEKRRQKAFAQYENLMRSRAVRSPAGATAGAVDKDKWLAARPHGYLEYREALGPEGTYGKWLRERPAVAKVQNLLLLHGGINPDFIQKPVDGINAQVRDEIRRFDRVRQLLIDRRLAVPSFTLQELVDAARTELERSLAVAQGQTGDPFGPTLNEIELRQVMDLLRIGTWYLLNENGPLWYRGYAKWTNADAEARLGPLLERYGVERIVVGHTTLANSRITARFSNRIFLIDTGMLTSYYKGRASALEIRDGRASALYVEDEPVRFDPE